MILSWTGFFLVTILFLRGVKSVTRCYCNDPSCVATSYMCKSQLGVCYSQQLPPATASSTAAKRYSCAESLPPSYDLKLSCLQNDVIFNNVSDVTRISPAVPRRIHDPVCCGWDMCNYERQAERDVERWKKNSSGNWFINMSASSDHDLSEKHQQSSKTSTQQRQHSRTADERRDSGLWFKSLVFVVLIVGAFILILLSFTAARILYSHGRQRRQHSYCHHHCHHHHPHHHYHHHLCYEHHQPHPHDQDEDCVAVGYTSVDSCNCHVGYAQSPGNTNAGFEPCRTVGYNTDSCRFNITYEHSPGTANRKVERVGAVCPSGGSCLCEDFYGQSAGPNSRVVEGAFTTAVPSLGDFNLITGFEHFRTVGLNMLLCDVAYEQSEETNIRGVKTCCRSTVEPIIVRLCGTENACEQAAETDMKGIESFSNVDHNVGS